MNKIIIMAAMFLSAIGHTKVVPFVECSYPGLKIDQVAVGIDHDYQGDELPSDYYKLDIEISYPSGFTDVFKTYYPKSGLEMAIFNNKIKLSYGENTAEELQPYSYTRIAFDAENEVGSLFGLKQSNTNTIDLRDKVDSFDNDLSCKWVR